MPTVMYCDDEEKFVESFSENHKGSEFAVAAFKEDVLSLPRHLENLRRLPDLIVLDLYHTRNPKGSQEASETNAAVDAKLNQIGILVEELRAIVEANKEPRALTVVELLRGSRQRRIRSLPVLIYTRQGLSLLGDKELKQAIALHADWMMKGRSPELERAKMHELIERTRPRGPARDVILTIVSAVLGTVLGVAVSYFS